MYAVTVLHYFNTNGTGLPSGGVYGYTITGFATAAMATYAGTTIQNYLKSDGTNGDGTVHTKCTAYQMS